jgi:hypothetical protein
VVGYSNTQTVKARATAIWGAAGAFTGIAPFMLNLSASGCDIPNIPKGTNCGFWLDSNDIGNAQWSMMNLNQWNVPPSTNCTSAGTGSTLNWINGGAPALPLNYPNPTYVCLDTGAVPPVFFGTCNGTNSDPLICKKGKELPFPVNCPRAIIDCPDSTGQIDKVGLPAPPPASADKYDIVGFTYLLIVDVLKGNDPAAIGTPAANGSCVTPHDFTLLPPGNTFDLHTASPNCNPSTSQPLSNLANLVLSKKSGNVTITFVQGVDYQFNSSTDVITWLKPNLNGVQVKWDWATPAVPGACGNRPSNSNAKCLATQYEGYTTGGIDVGGGQNFGVRAIGLSG